MKTTIQSTIRFSILAIVALSFAAPANADEVVTVDPTQTWQTFMNVFEADRSGGAAARGGFVFESSWALADATAEFVPGELILGPNSIGDPDPFWYIGGGGPGALGNKWMDANTFVQVTTGLSGISVTFERTILSNSFTGAHTGTVFIRDFVPDFSSFVETTAAMTPGDFSINLATVADVGRHVQYGFNVAGENVWVTDRAPFGQIRVSAVPEPTSLSVLGLVSLGLVVRRRRK